MMQVYSILSRSHSTFCRRGGFWVHGDGSRWPRELAMWEAVAFFKHSNGLKLPERSTTVKNSALHFEADHNRFLHYSFTCRLLSSMDLVIEASNDRAGNVPRVPTMPSGDTLKRERSQSAADLQKKDTQEPLSDPLLQIHFHEPM